jgi:putative membrane protein
MPNSKTLFSISLALTLAAGCSRSNPDTVSPDRASDTQTQPVSAGSDATSTKDDIGAGSDVNDTQTDPNAPPPVTASADDSGTTKVEAPIEYKTSDDEIFGVLETINDEEIETAELAKKWAKNKRVKEFAAMMIKDHTAANERQKASRKAMDLRSTDSRLSSDIEGDKEQKRKTLKEVAKGDPFDRAYIDMMVESHAAVLEFIDTKLLPHAQMPDLRSELNTVRSSVESHLNMAKDIQSALNKPKT